MKKILFALAFFVIGVLSYIGVESVFPRNAISSHVSVFKIDPDAVLVDVNIFREKNGLKPLIENSNLCKVAEIRLYETSLNWNHNGFSSDRFCAVNCVMGENLAKNYKSEQAIVDAWENSPTHKAIMLYKDAVYGCVATDGKYTVLNISTMIPN